MVEVKPEDRAAAKTLLGIQEVRYHEDGTFRCWDDACEAFAQHRETTAEAERARIVAWLRDHASSSDEASEHLAELATAIERASMVEVTQVTKEDAWAAGELGHHLCTLCEHDKIEQVMLAMAEHRTEALRTGIRMGIEAAASRIMPQNDQSDWTEFARIWAEASQSIRALDVEAIAKEVGNG